MCSKVRGWQVSSSLEAAAQGDLWVWVVSDPDRNLLPKKKKKTAVNE